MAREGKTLEFKQVMMTAKSEQEVIQFLTAASAFANLTGGDLLIGIAADEGIAQSKAAFRSRALMMKNCG